MNGESLHERKEIFASLRELLRRYSPPLVIRFDEPGRYELWSMKEVMIAGRPKKEVFFASLIIQKSYVGFYFMPVYSNPEIKSMFPSGLLELLKGKSCFHIRKLDERLRDQVRDSLKKGFNRYRTQGWI